MPCVSGKSVKAETNFKELRLETWAKRHTSIRIKTGYSIRPDWHSSMAIGTCINFDLARIVVELQIQIKMQIKMGTRILQLQFEIDLLWRLNLMRQLAIDWQNDLPKLQSIQITWENIFQESPIWIDAATNVVPRPQHYLQIHLLRTNK